MKKRSVKPFVVMAIVSLLLTIAAVIATQATAQETDYQFAFFQSLGVAGLGGLITLIVTQIAASRAGRPWLIAKSVLATLVLFIAFVRFEGFSGEMIPRFAFRLSPKSVPPPLLTEAANVAIPQPDADDLASDAEPSATSSGTPDEPSWPGFLGPNRNGVIAERDFAIPQSPSEIETKWNIGVGSGWGSFAVAGNLAITTEQRGESQANSREWITAYDLQSGALIWKHSNPAYHFHPLGGEGPRTVPAVEDGKVYVHGEAGIVDCLELATGDSIWSVDLMELSDWTPAELIRDLPWGRRGSPLIIDDLCVLPLGGPESTGGQSANRSLVALDKLTGEVVWRSGDDQISYASPMLMAFEMGHGETSRQIVIVNEATVTGHEIATGKQLWSFPWEGDSSAGANCASAIPAGDNRFLLGKGYGGGSALVAVRQEKDKWIADALWSSSRVMKTKFNNALIDGDIAYGISNGALEAAELSSGQRRWIQSRRDRCGQGQVILAGDTLVVQAETGEVVLCKATTDEYEELLRIPAMESKTWNIPTLAGRYLLVRNDRQAFCFLLPPLR